MEASMLDLSWKGMDIYSEPINLMILVANWFSNLYLNLVYRGAVALDGRIEPGDMILQVNDINFENMSNDEAVRVLREVVQKPGWVSV